MAERKKEIPEVVVKVGAKISKIMKDKKLLARNVSADCGMDVEALRRYMAGKQTMGIDKVYSIANALGVEVGELFKD